MRNHCRLSGLRPFLDDGYPPAKVNANPGMNKTIGHSIEKNETGRDLMPEARQFAFQSASSKRSRDET